MRKIFLIISISFGLVAAAQVPAEKQRIIYGLCTKDSLLAEPFSKWFSPAFDGYKPNATTASQLKKINTNDLTIEVFFGSWCGDSKRELPRFLKLLNDLSFPAGKTKLIALGGGDSLLKQSPQREEAGKGIFRVPVFILYKKGAEIGRINEFPVYSLEKDLLMMLSGEIYTPNYQSFSIVKKWLADSTLLDDNINTNGLAGVLRHAVKNEHELNSLGYLLLKQTRKKEALRIFQINYSLYPESANIASSLGEGYYETGEFKKAILLLERSLDLNKTGTDTKAILEILYKAKENEKSL